MLLSLSSVTAESILRGDFVESLPELYATKHVVENNSHHTHQIVFDHLVKTMRAMDKLTADQAVLLRAEGTQQKFSLPLTDILRLTALFHDIGKTNTTAQRAGDTITFPGHEAAGADLLQNTILPRFEIASPERTYIVQLVREHFTLHALTDETNLLSERFVAFKQNYSRLALGLTFLVMADLYGSDLESADQTRFSQKILFLQNQLRDWRME